LKALEYVKRGETGDAEEQHRLHIAAPGFFFRLIDSATPINKALDRAEQRPQRCPLACEDPRHVPAERSRNHDHDRAEERDLQPPVAGHRIPRSFETYGPQPMLIKAPDHADVSPTERPPSGELVCFDTLKRSGLG
jgi:hypothetical protein